jgi:phosphotriesterase-related protein
MDRRTFLGTLGAAATLRAAEAQVYTVTGPVPVSKLGTTLMHEHVMVDFIGADGASPSRYNADEVYAVALPKLKEVAAQGCKTLVECTPNYLARDVKLLERLSKAPEFNCSPTPATTAALKTSSCPSTSSANRLRRSRTAGRWRQ